MKKISLSGTSKTAVKNKGLSGVNLPICLAPMVGLSHYPTRQAIRQYMPRETQTIWPTEMISSVRLPHDSADGLKRWVGPIDESDLVPQILVNQLEPLKRTMEILSRWPIRGIDINMGCPVKQALKHNYGVALMGDPEYAWKIVRMACSLQDAPVSVKLRVGEVNDSARLLEFCQGLVDAGASWLCLHPRTSAQKRRGRADWAQIQMLSEKLEVPIIGNGDVQVVDDVYRMLDETGCHMVMIGRALTARPWILWQFGEDQGMAPPEGRTGEMAPRTAAEEAREFYRFHCALLKEFESYFAPKLGIRKFLFHVKISSVWLPFGHTLHSQMTRAKSYEDLSRILDEFFAVEHSLSTWSDLRY